MNFQSLHSMRILVMRTRFFRPFKRTGGIREEDRSFARTLPASLGWWDSHPAATPNR
jgi:hypothetical protein